MQRTDYESRLRAMWLAENIAVWTGLPIENAYHQPPFLTDEDWGMPLGQGRTLDFVFQDPWRSDDDTDIEYVYMHLLDQKKVTNLTSADIVEGWRQHINHHIWNSNRNARTLMDSGVEPPATGSPAANHLRLLISAQLTIEMFGAVNPGMPERALEAANLPIRNAAFGYAAHACQFYVVLYSLATQTPADLPDGEKMLWLVRQARRFIPSTSKAADAVDFVVARFLTASEVDDWELTRDAIYQRYQLDSAHNGFRYWGWSDSTLNFANGIMALLHGAGDCRRTIQIATLAGWDCENQGATMAGLLGLVHGYDAIAAAFPGQALSDRYTHRRTRDALPDYLPSDPEAEDTFTLLASRMALAAQRSISKAGGLVDDRTGRWLLPPSIAMHDLTPGSADLYNPGVRDWLRSNNFWVRQLGGDVAAFSSAAPSRPPGAYPHVNGVGTVSNLANAVDQDFAGAEINELARAFYSTQNPGSLPRSSVTFSVIYDRAIPVNAIRFIEGNHFHLTDLEGGWLQGIKPELRIGACWYRLPAKTTVSNPPDPAKAFQHIQWDLPETIEATGVRIIGIPGGRHVFATAAELDTLMPEPSPPTAPSFDLNADGVIDARDLASFDASPVDLDGDGLSDDSDRRYLRTAVEWWD